MCISVTLQYFSLFVLFSSLVCWFADGRWYFLNQGYLSSNILFSNWEYIPTMKSCYRIQWDFLTVWFILTIQFFFLWLWQNMTNIFVLFFCTDLHSHFLMILELSQYLSKQKKRAFHWCGSNTCKKNILLINIILNRSSRTILFNVKTSSHLFFLTGVLI
jgi:hypothetical protein